MGPCSLKIESKVFCIQLDDCFGARAILISEGCREKNYHISLDLGGFAWLRAQLRELLKLGLFKPSLFCSYHGKYYQFWIETQVNNSGCFLRLSKCVNGVVRSMVLPKGVES